MALCPRSRLGRLRHLRSRCTPVRRARYHLLSLQVLPSVVVGSRPSLMVAAFVAVAVAVAVDAAVATAPSRACEADAVDAPRRCTHGRHYWPTGRRFASAAAASPPPPPLAASAGRLRWPTPC